MKQDAPVLFWTITEFLGAGEKENEYFTEVSLPQTVRKTHNFQTLNTPTAYEYRKVFLLDSLY